MLMRSDFPGTFILVVLLSHAKALKRKLNLKPGKYNPLHAAFGTSYVVRPLIS